MPRLLSFIGGAFLAFALIAAPASAKTLFVDDNGLDCQQATFTSVQAAVTAAGPNDTVKVCNGTYAEQVLIDNKDGLKLEGLNKDGAVIRYPATSTNDEHSLIQISDSDKVALRFLTVSGPYVNAGCTEPEDNHLAVFVDNSFDVKIEHNEIVDIRNSLPSLYGCQDGIAVSVGDSAQDSSGSADVRHNEITGYQKGGVLVDNTGSDARVSHNTISAAEDVQPFIAPNGVQVSNGASARVDHNEVTENIYGPSTIGDYAGTGILLYQPKVGGVRVSQNEVYRNDDGISSYDSDGQRIEQNNSNDNRVYDGLFFDADSEGNLVLGNDATGNNEDDCHDDSNGTGTAGTANTWRNNTGNTENREGLCKPAN